MHLMGTLYLSIFALCWYFFSMITYGSAVPSGLFLPPILVGSSIGFLWENMRVALLNIQQTEISSLPIIVGAACMISGQTRLTYSVIVLVLEASGSFDLAVPMFLAVWCSNTVGSFMTTSLFQREIRGKQMPFLSGNCPQETSRIEACQIMSKTLVTVQTIADMRSIKKALSSTHNAFPVLNTHGNFVGLIPKSIINTLAN